ncbi:hypothetical protein JKP88DRAFT_250367 [Tribonema minus]|uniref:Uncharacterized protein n=1 Tax=Tribonema minus TaxID=303371 RepID=A0A836C737_9STRA|nr:hypothetical protein JKP88DRAFT_250367 [Tribonema minus]
MVMAPMTSFGSQLIEAWLNVTDALGQGHPPATYISALALELQSMDYVVHCQREAPVMYKQTQIGTVVPDMTVEHDCEVSLVGIESDDVEYSCQLQRMRAMARCAGCEHAYMLNICDEAMTTVNAHNAMYEYHMFQRRRPCQPMVQP